MMSRVSSKSGSVAPLMRKARMRVIKQICILGLLTFYELDVVPHLARCLSSFIASLETQTMRSRVAAATWHDTCTFFK